jgi:hypothetical protein
MNIVHAYSNQVPDGTATSVVRPSDWNSAHVQQVTLSGNVVGQSSFSAHNVVMQGGPNVTLSGIVAGAMATLLVSAANPAAAYSLANSNGIIFGTSNGQVTASYSVPATYPQTQQPMAYAAGGATKTANTLPFANANGVSFVAYGSSIAGSVRTDYASSDVTTNALALSNSSLLQPVSNTSAITSAAMPLAGSTAFQQASNSSLFQLTSGMAAYQRTSATSNITSNALHSTATSGITSAAMPLANSSALQFLSNTSGITSAAIHTSLSSLFTGGGTGGGGGGAAIQGSGTYSQNTGTVQFANSNGVTFGLSNNGVMTASVVAGDFSNSSLLAASDHDHGAFQLNMTNLSGSVTTQSNGLTINLSAAAGGGLVVSAGTRSRDTGTVEFQNGNGVSFGMDGLGHLTASASSITFSNYNGVSFGVAAGVVTASVASATDIVANHVRVWASGGYGTSTTVSATAVKFYDANNVSFGINSVGEVTATAAAYPISLTLLTDDAYGSQTFNMTDGMRLGKMAGGTWYAPIAFTTFSHLQGTAIGGMVANSALPMLNVNNMPNTLYGANRLTDLSMYGVNGIGISTAWYDSTPNNGSISINGASLIRTDLSLALTNISATKSVSNGQMTLSLSAGAGGQYSLSNANGLAFTTYTSNSQVSASDGAAVYGISVNGSNIVASQNAIELHATGNMTAYVPSINAGTVSLGVPFPTLSLVNLSGAISTQAGGEYVIRLTGGTGGGGGGIALFSRTNSTDFNAYDVDVLPAPAIEGSAANYLDWDAAYAAGWFNDGTHDILALKAQYGAKNIIAMHTEHAGTYRNLSETIFRNRPLMIPLGDDEFRRMQPNNLAPPDYDINARIFVSGAASSNRSLGGTVRLGLYTINQGTWEMYASASEAFNFTASSQSSLWNGPTLIQFTGLTASNNGNWINDFKAPMALLMFSPVSANATWFNLPIYGAPSIPTPSRIYSNGSTAAIASSRSIAAFEGMFTTTTGALPATFAMSQFMASASQHVLRPWFEIFDPSGIAP